MKRITFQFKLMVLALGIGVLTGCEEGADLTGVELRQDENIIQGGEECKDYCAELEDEGTVIIDFAEFQSNDVVTETKGVKIAATTNASPFTPLQTRVFNTDRTTSDVEFCPTFDDNDLLFPDNIFGNVLVIQDENSPNCANDRRAGGQIRFNFDDAYPNGVTLNCLDLLDTEEAGNIQGQPVNGAIILFARDEEGVLSQIGDLIPVPATADGEGQVIPIGQSGVDEMLFVALGSGAISNICFAPAPLDECAPGAELLDFEEFAENEVITTSKGVNITGAITPAITFDTEDPEMCPKFDDTDMIFTGEGFGNVLVNQHRSKTDCANADPRGGTLTFEFPTPSTINSMDFFDTEEKGSTVTFYGVGDAMLGTANIPQIGDGEWQTVAPAIQGVVKFVIDFAGSGGVDNVCYTPSPEPQ